MPNPLELTGDKVVLASAARTGAGTGTPVDIGDRSYVELVLDVTAISGTLSVEIETSATLSGWKLAYRVPPVTDNGDVELVIADAKRYIRAKWIANTSSTFSLTGTAHQLYAKPKDVEVFGLPKGSLNNVPPLDIARACLSASAEAEGYLAAAYDLPIATLDAATRKHITAMAVFELMKYRPGKSVETAQSNELGYSIALKWLGGVAAGKTRPVGVVDSTPGNDAPGTPGASGGGSTYIIGKPGRGW